MCGASQHLNRLGLNHQWIAAQGLGHEKNRVDAPMMHEESGDFDMETAIASVSLAKYISFSQNVALRVVSII